KGGAVTGNGLRLYNAFLNFDGGSSGTFIFRTTGFLTGTVPAGSNVKVEANNESSSGNFVIAATSGSGGNNGTITLTSVDGAYASNLTRFSNAGTINVQPGTGGARSIGTGSGAALINTGTININADTAIGGVDNQTGGTVAIAAGKLLSAGANFVLNGGTVAADGVN